MLATCSREHSQRLSAHAHSEIERANGFGEGMGVPVARRGPVRVPRWRSLAAFPELVRELHPQRNAELDDLAAVAAKSSRRLWWRCAACGHDWQATVGSRAAGAGCPACDNERKRRPRTVPRERSLHALHPELVAEWHLTRNGEIDAAHLSPASKHRALAALRAGAVGHIGKDVDPDELARLVVRAADGEAIIPQRLMMPLLELLRELPDTGWRPLDSRLTTREWEIVELLALGATTQGIAERLVLSPTTVYSHVRSVLRKLGVHSRRDAVAAAERLRREEVLGTQPANPVRASSFA